MINICLHDMKNLVGNCDVACFVGVSVGRPVWDPKMDPKSVQKRSQIGSKTVLEGFWMKIAFRSVKKRWRDPAGELRPSTNRRILDLLGEGNREGADGFARLITLVQGQGVAG